MKRHRISFVEFVRKPLVAAGAGLVLLGGALTAPVQADPAQDALAQLTELSRQVEQLTESMHAAQLDLDTKVGAQTAAEARHAADLAALDAARSQVVSYQGAVDRFAAASYVGGRPDGLNAVLTAPAPQDLIEKMSVQSVMAAEMAARMEGFRRISDEASAIEAASATSAAEAKSAADAAAAVRADLQRKQSELQVQIAAVKARYESLTAAQRAALAGPVGPPPAAPPAPPVEIAALAARPMPGPGTGAGAAAAQAALTRVGAPYAWGGNGPNAFDCSGLVTWAFRQAGMSLPRSSHALAAAGQPVSLDQIQPGDVVAQYSDASHVGIYIGNGMMVHASTYGIPVRVESIHNAPIYNVRRF